jgi:hypothetical protein
MQTGNINYDTLRDLHELYLNGKHKLLPGNTEEGETKFIWFELNASMRSFLEQVLNEDVDGIKVYILQYPETQQEIRGEIIPKNADDLNQLTVGFVTTKMIDGQRVDYFESENQKKLMVLAPPMNHGELCPRLCP